MRQAVVFAALSFFTSSAFAQITQFPSSRLPWPTPGQTTTTPTAQLQTTTPVPVRVIATETAAAANKESRSNDSSMQSQLAQMLSNFGQGGMGGTGNASGSTGAGRGTASAGAMYGGGSGSVDMRSCGEKSADPTALETLFLCADRKLSAASNSKAALVDVDQKVMFIVDRNTKRVEGCVNIATGKSTGAGTGQTPTGMMITGPHNGPKYQSNADGTVQDCVGLKGTDPETIKRSANGVVMHKAHGRAGTAGTAGCIGVEDAKFDAIKDILYGSDKSPKSSAIFIHDKYSRAECNGTGREGSNMNQLPSNSNTGQ
ncbi:MAG: hypothetical protein KF799_14455 [Bdellovibrionales bacterium]|nr:hypothetical protein [Bdellovibrionales bacterium]